MEQQLPTAEQFFCEQSLYTKFKYNGEQLQELYNLFYYIGTIDAYCTECEKDSVFEAVENRPKSYVHSYSAPIGVDDFLLTLGKTNVTVKNFRCNRNVDHVMSFLLRIKGETFSKIGQYPSHADLTKQKLKKYRKVLTAEYSNELNKAWGLYSHGSGVGAFAYLRRVVEIFIIKPAYEKAALNPTWNESEFQKLRVGERIKLLKNYLPSFLVQNSTLYGIISKGIHELSETECLQFFPILNSCLDLILTELEQQREVDEAKAKIAAEIAKIAAAIK